MSAVALIGTLVPTVSSVLEAGAAVPSPQATLTPNGWPTVEPATVTMLGEGLEPGVTYTLQYCIWNYDINDPANVNDDVLLKKECSDQGSFTAGADGTASKQVTLEPEINGAFCHAPPAGTYASDVLFAHSCGVTIWTADGAVVTSAWFLGFNQAPTAPSPRLFLEDLGPDDNISSGATATASGDRFPANIGLEFRQCRLVTGPITLQTSGVSCRPAGTATVGADGTFSAPAELLKRWLDVDCTYQSDHTCILQAVHNDQVLAFTPVFWGCPRYQWIAVLDVDPRGGDAPLSVTADAAASYNLSDCPAAIESYTFDFGDGTVAGPSSSATANHTYMTPGDYLVTLTIIDESGTSSTSTEITDPKNIYSDTRLSNQVIVGVGNPDTDGDGVLNSVDNCPADPNADQADNDSDGFGNPCDDYPDCAANDELTCDQPPPPPPDPDPDPPGCTTNATARGYTVAHYDADLNVALAPDPDFFDWDVSASWCVEENQVRITSTDSLSLVTLDPTTATALELVGVTFRHDANDNASFLIDNGSAATGLVTASTDFDVCANPFSLLTAGAGSVLKKAGIWTASKILGKMPGGGTTAAWIDDLALRVDKATLGTEDRLLGGLKRTLNSRLVTPFLPRAIEQRLNTMLDDAIGEVGLALRGQDPTNSLAAWADSGTRPFFEQYADDSGRIVIPRKGQAQARRLWNDITADLALEIADRIADLINYNACGTVWHPILEIYIPKAGESFVNDSQVDASIFDVKGGIVTDARS